MIYKKQQNLVGFLLKSGKRKMGMGRVQASMTLQVSLILTKKNCSKICQVSFLVSFRNKLHQLSKRPGKPLMKYMQLLLTKSREKKIWVVTLEKQRAGATCSHYCVIGRLATRGQMLHLICMLWYITYQNSLKPTNQ